VLAKACTAAGISKRLTAHGLRRTFNDLARRVSNREVVMAITGHTTDRMFEHYSLVDAAEKQAVSVRLLELAAASELPPKVEDPVEAQEGRAA
jgi:integrase